MLLIQNGRVLDPWTGTDAQLDVLIGNDGVIAKIAEKIDARRIAGFLMRQD